MPDRTKLFIIGAGGHAKVLIQSLKLVGYFPTGCSSVTPSEVGSSVLGIPVIADDALLSAESPTTTVLVNGVGTVSVAPNPRTRVFETWKSRGFKFLTVIHPGTIIAEDVTVGEGAQIMAGAIIQPGSVIGANTIINTSASIDHDCHIEEHVHIAPGSVLSGGVHVGAGTFMGTGTRVIQNISIGRHALIGAGALVIRNVPEGTSVRGVPAKVHV